MYEMWDWFSMCVNLVVVLHKACIFKCVCVCVKRQSAEYSKLKPSHATIMNIYKTKEANADL